MMKIDNLELKEALQKDNLELFNTADQVWNLASEIKLESAPTEDWAQCLVGVKKKQMGLYLACYTLCRDGMALEAQILERTMFIVWGYLNAMKDSPDPKEFARLWLIWDYANEAKNTQSVLTGHTEDQALQTQMSRLNEKIASDKTKMGNNWENFVHNGPALKGPTQIAKSIDPSVKTYFHVASGSVHGYDLWSFARYPANMQTSFTSETCADVLNGIIQWLGISIVLINEHMNFHKDSQISALLDILIKTNNTTVDKEYCFKSS